MKNDSLTDAEVIGVGGMATVYRQADGTALKLFRRGISLEDVQHEYDMALAAFNLGMPVPEPYSVECHGVRFGIRYERIHGDTLSSLMTQHPERVESYAVLMAELFRKLHSTHVEGGGILPDVHSETVRAIHRVSHVIGEDGVGQLLQILHSIPHGDSLLHCDLHPRNVMTDGNRFFLIDVGEVGFGNPLIDLANTHSLMTSGLVDFQRFVGFPQEYATPFWDTLLRAYLGASSPRALDELKERLSVLSLIRCFTWLATSDGLPEEVIVRFRGHFQHLVKDRWQEISQMSL